MRWAPPALLVALTLAAFMPTLRNGFVAWDDLDNFTLNQSYRGLGWPQIKWMFTSAKLGHYIPVTWLTLGLDYVLWGMNAAGYHLTSLLIHAGGALALYFLALRLFELARPEAPPLDLRVGAFLASLVFAVHPFRVESVAWVTERRDVVSGLFYVLTVLAYLKAVAGRERPRPGWYVASLGLFAAALLSKSIVVTLPAALVILDVYPLRRLGGARGWLRWRVWLEKLPYLALSAITTLIAFMALFTLQNTRSLEHMSVLHRIVLSVYGLTFYLVKTVAPLELAPLYELAVVFVPWWYFAFVLAAITVCVAFRRRWPALTAGDPGVQRLRADGGGVDAPLRGSTPDQGLHRPRSQRPGNRDRVAEPRGRIRSPAGRPSLSRRPLPWARTTAPSARRDAGSPGSARWPRRSGRRSRRPRPGCSFPRGHWDTPRRRAATW